MFYLSLIKTGHFKMIRSVCCPQNVNTKYSGKALNYNKYNIIFYYLYIFIKIYTISSLFFVKLSLRIVYFQFYKLKRCKFKKYIINK